MKIKKLMIGLGDTESATLRDSVYDVAYCIMDKKGNIALEKNWLVEEVFTNKKLMTKAYYADKYFSVYPKMLSDGKIKLRPWLEIIAEMNKDFEEHGVSVFAAYNAGFDLRALQNTHEQLGYTGNVFNADYKTLCIWQFGCEAKLTQKSYARMARRLGWVSDKNNIMTNAEKAYRYCSGDLSFVEDHTALSDARIEVEILAECFRQKKKIPYNVIDKMPWRMVQKTNIDNVRTAKSKFVFDPSKAVENPNQRRIYPYRA